MKKLSQTLNQNYDKEQVKLFNQLLEKLKTAQNLSQNKKLFVISLKKGIITAQILTQVKIDIDSLLAALVLNLFKHNLVTAEELKVDKATVKLIENALQFDKIIYEETKENIVNLRAMFVAMSKDIRTLIIKLADVLQTALNPQDLSQEELTHLHKEIKEIYAPLAARLGLNYIKGKLQDENFKFLEPAKYEAIRQQVFSNEFERTIVLNKTIKKMKKLLKDLNMEGQVYGRIKHISSVYKKLDRISDLASIYDLSALRIIVQNVNDCYTVLGVVHTMFAPIEGHFRDYIAKPKPNGYKSLHTSVYVDKEQIIEVQIRTQEMHYFAEYGVAAHWLYKEKNTKQNVVDQKLTWIRQIIENADLSTSNDILKELKTDDYDGSIYVQTPKGNIIELPAEATPVDFAYNIHSEVGNKCVGAKVNGKMVPLATKLKNGETVEIITHTNSKGPSRDWLKFVKSSGAREKINAYFKRERKDENIKRGKQILEQAAKTKNVQLHKLLEEKALADLFERYSLKNLDDMYASVGHGAMTATQVLNRLIRFYEEHTKEEKTLPNRPVIDTQTKNNSKNDIIIKGLDNILTKFAKCCTPIPGDEIVAYISRGKGATVHRANCKTIRQTEPERLLEADWGNIEDVSYPAEIKVLTKNAPGVLALITNRIAELKINIVSVVANQISTDKAMIDLVVIITKKEHLSDLMSKLTQLNTVYEVFRANEK